MENIITIQGYHTCKTEGGWSYIRENAPFLSEPNNRQWLTQGYYFWTDSDYFAHQWGRQSIKGDYAIVECSIEIERRLFLDLVGSVEDQLIFYKMFTKYNTKLKRANPNAQKPTVDAVLSFYKNYPDNFPYKAIKVYEESSKDKIYFIGTKNEKMSLLTRQQLCLFEPALGCIKLKNIIHPEQFTKDYLSLKT